jgi:RNA polymerase sigma-70 factor (ECF subfamily)
VKTERQNEQWIIALSSQGADQAIALAELRDYLRTRLPGCLRQYGEVPADLIEDVVQEALLRVLDRLGDFEGRSRFTTWCVSLAARIAMTELRRHRWRDVSLDALLESGALEPSSQPDGSDTPEDRLSQSKITRALQSLIDESLTERQRIATVAEMCGLPQEEVGRRMGTNRNAVYKLVHDARRKLKSGLEAQGFDSETIRAAFS